jgi:acyl carrier protein
MDRDTIRAKILAIFDEEFEIVDPGEEDDLREVHGFDSIDAIELLREIEIMLDSELTRDEKKKAMDIRTMNQIYDYVASLSADRQ